MIIPVPLVELPELRLEAGFTGGQISTAVPKPRHAYGRA